MSSLWIGKYRYTDDLLMVQKNPDKISRLYFLLANERATVESYEIDENTDGHYGHVPALPWEFMR